MAAGILLQAPCEGRISAQCGQWQASVLLWPFDLLHSSLRGRFGLEDVQRNHVGSETPGEDRSSHAACLPFREMLSRLGYMLCLAIKVSALCSSRLFKVSVDQTQLSARILLVLYPEGEAEVCWHHITVRSQCLMCSCSILSRDGNP